MSKRTKIIIKTKEAEALRRLREMRGLSVRKAADLLGISHTMVNHLEIGRANISEEYIEKFLKALNLSHEDWKSLVAGALKKTAPDRRKLIEECNFLLQRLSEDKLRVIQNMLAKF